MALLLTKLTKPRSSPRKRERQVRSFFYHETGNDFQWRKLGVPSSFFSVISIYLLKNTLKTFHFTLDKIIVPWYNIFREWERAVAQGTWLNRIKFWTAHGWWGNPYLLSSEREPTEKGCKPKYCGFLGRFRVFLNVGIVWRFSPSHSPPFPFLSLKYIKNFLFFTWQI